METVIEGGWPARHKNSFRSLIEFLIRQCNVSLPMNKINGRMHLTTDFVVIRCAFSVNVTQCSCGLRVRILVLQSVPTGLPPYMHQITRITYQFDQWWFAPRQALYFCEGPKLQSEISKGVFLGDFASILQMEVSLPSIERSLPKLTFKSLL